MNKHHEFPYDAAAAELSNEEWLRLPPVAVNNRQWLLLDRPPETEVRGVYDEEALYVQFRVFEESPVVRHKEDGAPVYEDSCVEFFVQPIPDKDSRYFNFELNAAGTLLLEVGEPRENRQKIADAPIGIRAEVGLRDPASGRIYWKLDLRIPFAFIRRSFPDFRAVPGAAMRGNFYKCGDRTPAPHYLSWAEVQSAVPDFHRSASFGTLTLGDRHLG
ncbi:carbohydrate-binding family 9-like protein [Paenibacillus arenilitoris]|uniref:Carbohydrate-binding domain-containing protein n=1 Tax=Paenibacillus arenilitoris TaxID=2772299 RepID=A0A927H7J8_9BACL|nr:carbohydrate-binding family 9-like protein [Paenibacillus arenilitoris]MBD2871696.1 hypothetical protein [Paenibacillus arenilitoris]